MSEPVLGAGIKTAVTAAVLAVLHVLASLNVMNVSQSTQDAILNLINAVFAVAVIVVPLVTTYMARKHVTANTNVMAYTDKGSDKVRAGEAADFETGSVLAGDATVNDIAPRHLAAA